MKKSIKFFAIQEEHIKNLQEKLDNDKNEFFREFMETPGWELFLGRHTSSYQRPKEVIPRLKEHFVKLELEFPNRENIISEKALLPDACMFIITYRSRPYTSHFSKFRTHYIKFEDIENFINKQS